MKNINFESRSKSQDVNEAKEGKSDFESKNDRKIESEAKNFFLSHLEKSIEDSKLTSYDRKLNKRNVIDKKDTEKALNMADAKKGLKPKIILSDKPATTIHNYTMNTPKNIEHMRNQMSDAGKEYFDSQIKAGGGVNGQYAHLRGVGKEYFMTIAIQQIITSIFIISPLSIGVLFFRIAIVLQIKKLQETFCLKTILEQFLMRERKIYNYPQKMMRVLLIELYQKKQLLY